MLGMEWETHVEERSRGKHALLSRDRVINASGLECVQVFSAEQDL